MWKNRVSDEVKHIVDLNKMVEDYKNALKDLPQNFGRITATKAMIKSLREKGVKIHDAVHLLRVCEVLPYSGCGCCEHRR